VRGAVAALRGVRAREDAARTRLAALALGHRPELLALHPDLRPGGGGGGWVGPGPASERMTRFLPQCFPLEVSRWCVPIRRRSPPCGQLDQAADAEEMVDGLLRPGRSLAEYDVPGAGAGGLAV